MKLTRTMRDRPTRRSWCCYAAIDATIAARWKLLLHSLLFLCMWRVRAPIRDFFRTFKSVWWRCVCVKAMKCTRTQKQIYAFKFSIPWKLLANSDNNKVGWCRCCWCCFTFYRWCSWLCWFTSSIYIYIFAFIFPSSLSLPLPSHFLISII